MGLEDKSHPIYNRLCRAIQGKETLPEFWEQPLAEAMGFDSGTELLEKYPKLVFSNNPKVSSIQAETKMQVVELLAPPEVSPEAMMAAPDNCYMFALAITKPDGMVERDKVPLLLKAIEEISAYGPMIKLTRLEKPNK